VSKKQKTIPDTPCSRVADPVSFYTDPDIGFLNMNVDLDTGLQFRRVEKKHLFPVELGGKSKKILGIFSWFTKKRKIRKGRKPKSDSASNVSEFTTLKMF